MRASTVTTTISVAGAREAESTSKATVKAASTQEATAKAIAPVVVVEAATTTISEAS